jgi:hypothetical protein
VAKFTWALQQQLFELPIENFMKGDLPDESNLAGEQTTDA